MEQNAAVMMTKRMEGTRILSNIVVTLPLVALPVFKNLIFIQFLLSANKISQGDSTYWKASVAKREILFFSKVKEKKPEECKDDTNISFKPFKQQEKNFYKKKFSRQFTYMYIAV